jgi:replicative DNA helicase
VNAHVSPHDYAAEEAVLGAALLDPEAAQLVAGVDSAVFYPEKHRAVARAIGRLVHRSEPVDGHTVKAELAAAGDLELAGGSAALALLFERGHVAAYVPTYLATLTRLAARRDLIRLGLDMVRSARDEGSADVQTLIAGTFERLLAVEYGIAEAIVPPERLAEELTQTEHSDGIPTGISLIDDHLDGLQAGHLVVLAGRPGLGKTALAVQVAHRGWTAGADPSRFQTHGGPESRARWRASVHRYGDGRT